MKSIGIFVMSFFLATATLSASPDVVADDGCTFYFSKDYRGKTKKCDNGDHYPNKWGWAPRSLRVEQGCKVVFYYTDRFGKDKQYTFNGSEKDLYRKMSQWKFKNNKYWDYVKKVVVICGGGNGHANQGGNNHNNGNNNGGGWKTDFDKGRFVCFQKGNYGDNHYGYQFGTYRKNNWKFGFYSFRIPRGTQCVVRYQNRNGQYKEHVFTKDVKDLNTYFRQWNLRDWKKGWQYVDYFRFEKFTGGNGMASSGNNGNNSGNNNSGGWKADFDKGRFVCFQKGNYGDNYYGYQYGTYRKNNWKFGFYSFRIPRGTQCVVRYQNRNGQYKEHVFTKDVKDLNTYFRQWNLRDWKKGWQYVDYFRFEKFTGGNGMASNGNNGNNSGNNNSGGWKADFDKGRFVCFQKGNYGDNHYGYQFGTYRKNNWKFGFYSFRIPRGTQCVVRYQNRNGEYKEHVFTKDVKDINTYFRQWNLRDWKKGWQYVDYFRFEKFTGGNGNGGNNGGGNANQRGGPLAKGGYVVFYQYPKFEGSKFDKPQGAYDYRRLKFIPGSFVLSGSRYIVMQYQNKRKQIKSEVFKRNIHDLEYELRQLGAYDERNPLKSLRKITIMVE